ncbi:MAG: 16S rRNA (guanine(966)-N(2))-methyltransferase RsmD [Lachnospiraceae bacterium]|nr:16S rRNA (guanine(966)-N(2))-methyltransferase RsmD [Lachnospiraceae bacterium]
MRVIAGSARSLRLTAPKGMEVRPTTDRIKETLFNIISADIYDCSFLDLFCGSGAIGIEALSRGASKAVFIDESKTSCDCTLKNLEFTRLGDKAKVIRMDAVSAVTKLRNEGARFDIIFLDPPYDKELEKTVLEQKAFCDILNEDGFVIVEASSETAFDYAGSCGLEVYREKVYGSNKHVFMRKGTKTI